jgi:hypothetical protein
VRENKQLTPRFSLSLLRIFRIVSVCDNDDDDVVNICHVFYSAADSESHSLLAHLRAIKGEHRIGEVISGEVPNAIVKVSCEI